MLRVGSRESSSVIISIKFLISIGFFDNEYLAYQRFPLKIRSMQRMR